MTEEELHSRMNEAMHVAVCALEAAGFDPCPAIKVAQEAMREAWDVWGIQAEHIASQSRTLEYLNRADRPAIRSVSAGAKRTWHVDGDDRTFGSVQELVAAMEGK